MKNILRFIRSSGLILWTMLVIFSGSVYAAGGIMSGSGTTANPFLVADYGDLKVIGTTETYSLSAIYRLISDIDASASQTENSGAGFVPIGNGTAYFIGKFHGAGHVIKNLYINRSAADIVGLFGYIRSAIIDSFGVLNANITGGSCTGCIVGANDGTITDCYATGNVAADSNGYAGGITGGNGGRIINCYATGSVTGNYGKTGGLVGSNSGMIANCYATGNITGNHSCVGGFAGASVGTIANCYASGNVTGNNSCIGGFVGENYDGATTRNCYAVGNVTGSGNDVGGVAGLNTDSISNCYWDTQVTGQASGCGDNESMFSGSGLTTTQMKQSSSFNGWDFTTVWSINSNINNGYPYLASNRATSVEGLRSVSLKTYTLFQNYPNPFNPTTTIQFSVEKDGRAVVKAFDLLGREAATLYDNVAQAGKNYTAIFDGSRLSSGVYFYMIESNNQRIVKKMLLLK